MGLGSPRLRILAAAAAIVLLTAAQGAAVERSTQTQPQVGVAPAGRTMDEPDAPIRHRALPELVPARRDDLTRALAAGSITEARYALARARSLFRIGIVRRQYGRVERPNPRDATMILRDLVARYPQLSGRERRVARSILARPTDGAADPVGNGYTVPEAAPLCSTNACYHYVTTTDDAPDLTDANVNGVPDYVDSVGAVLENVWAVEITTLGFRAPKSDLTSVNHGPDGKIDFYVTQLGDQALYGYCTTDDPNAFSGTYPYFDFSAYCVIDDDYALADFPPPSASGLAALQVTTAHEFFHASQFAYDLLDDRWLLEGTATWIEDEVYDDVNDNVVYLFDSPITKPQRPLDSNNSRYGVYGGWIFFRFLSEYFASSGVHDTAVIRRAWELADGSAAGPDEYSLRAIAHATEERGVPFRSLLASFAARNDFPAKWYEEGSSQRYPLPPLAAKHTITARRDVVVDGYRMKHLTNRYIAFKPGRGVRSTAKLLVVVDLPAYRTGSEASVVTRSKSGAVKYYTISLGRRGDGSRRVPFGRRAIARVHLVLTNASTRTTCWVDPNSAYSCAGAPRDDGLRYAFGVALVQ